MPTREIRSLHRAERHAVVVEPPALREDVVAWLDAMQHNVAEHAVLVEFVFRQTKREPFPSPCLDFV